MAKRERKTLAPAQSYFVAPKEHIQFVPSGCTLLDCVMGGGYPLGRVINIVGDKSTAKTALATEAMINLLRTYPNGSVRYCESEAAFDQKYAEAMGLPLDKVDFGDPENPVVTVEGFARDFEQFLEAQKAKKRPGIYVLDSLDALSDEAEMDRDFGEGTYGTAKAKGLSELFRKLARKCEQSQVLLMVISQVRDNIGALFGDKHRRSGGRALDFYSSIVIWLAHIKTLTRTINKVERPYGVLIRAKCKKNKVAVPFRECDFMFLFGYGVDDVGASLHWLEDIGRLDVIDLKPSEIRPYMKKLEEASDKELAAEHAEVCAAVKKVWAEVETTFIPKRRKYQ